jgi:lambda family phage tail tape measure protein
MALVAGQLEIKLFADLARLQQDMNRANKTVDTAMNNIDKSVRIARNAFNGLVGAFSAGAVIKMVDDYKKFDAQIKLATRGLNEYTAAYENVIRIGRTAQSDIGAIGVLYARLTNNLRDFGTTQKEISNITESVALSLRVSNATVQETNSVMLQLSQSFGSGIINGQEFLAVSEGAPIIMRQLAKSLGVTYGELKNLSAQSKLTADKLAKALNDPEYLAGLRQQVKEVGTISSALTVLQNNIKQFLGEADKANGASKAFANTLILLGDNLSTLATVAIGYGIVQFVKYTQGIYANILATKQKAEASILATRVELSLAKASYDAGVVINTNTKFLMNNASATTLATSNTAKLAIAQQNLARATSATATAMRGLNTVLNALGGWVGIAVTGVILFGDKIVALGKKALGITPAMERLNELMERNGKLRSMGLDPSDPNAGKKSQIQEDIKLLDQLRKSSDRYFAISKGVVTATKKEISSLSLSGELYGNNALLKERAGKMASEYAKRVIEAEKAIKDNQVSIDIDSDAKNRKQAEKDKKILDGLKTRADMEKAYKAELALLIDAQSRSTKSDAEKIEQQELLKQKYKELFNVTKNHKDELNLAKKVQDEYNKSVAESVKLNTAQLESIDSQTKSTIEQTAQILRNIDILNSSEQAVEALELARLNDAIAAGNQGLEYAKLNGATAEQIAFTEQAIAELENLAKARDKFQNAKVIEAETKARIEAEKELNKAQEKTKEVIEEQKDGFAELKSAVNGYSRQMARSLADFALTGKKSFGDMINDMLRNLLTFVNQVLIFDPLIKSFTASLSNSGLFSGGSGFLGNIGSVIGSAIGGSGGVSATAGAYSIENNPYLNGTFAKGGVVSGAGISSFSSSIVDKPTTFAFAKGAGLMGEAGAEAIMPLKRDSSGRLGVSSDKGGNNVTINVIEAQGTKANVQQSQNPDGTISISVIIEQLYGAMNRDIQRGTGIAPTLERRYGLNRVAGAY